MNNNYRKTRNFFIFNKGNCISIFFLCHCRLTKQEISKIPIEKIAK